MAIRELESVHTDRKLIPIAAIMASLLKDQIEKCYVAGMDDHIPKPYTCAQLIPTLNMAIITGSGAKGIPLGQLWLIIHFEEISPDPTMPS